ncbi:MAG TPA: flagellar hook-basal body complex protein FliE [Bacteroidota bacterium]|nr:flagellar hook-basal body complex protein FliE [Bacteroidota bacterium]
MNINPVSGLLPGQSAQAPASKAGRETGGSFSEVLRDSISSVNDLQNDAGAAIEGMVSGEATDLHDVMIAVEKAKTSFDLLMEVRNKGLAAYQELMRIQV